MDGNERLCAMNTPFTVKQNLPQAGLELGTARSVGQCLTHRASGALLWTKVKIYHNMVGPPVRGDKPRALASGLSPVQGDNPWYNYYIPPSSV